MNREKRRTAFRRLLMAFVFGGTASGAMLGSESASGQLRTGREGQREFYRDEGVRTASTRSGTPAQVPKQVQKSPQDVAKAPTRMKPKPQVVSQIPRDSEWDPDQKVLRNDAQPSSVMVLSDDDATVASHTEAEYVAPSVACNDCGTLDGACGCDSVPHVNIRFPFPFARVLSRVSARVEAATFWGSDPGLPGLVRTAAVGTAGSSDLFGGSIPMDEAVQGYRAEVGWLLGNDPCSSIQLRFFDANTQSQNFNSSQSNATSVVRPYFDPVANLQESISILEGGVSTGALNAQATSNVFGGDLLLRQWLHRNACDQLDLLIGFQTASLSDSIAIDSTTTSLGSADTLFLQDRFDSNNRFYGATLGLSQTYRGPRWSLSGMFKLGLGNMERYVGIDGFQEITVGPPPISSSENAGLLARGTNIGTYHSDTFIVSPEVNVTLSYRLSRNWEATLGYSYLGLPKVLRAADQISPNLATNLSNPLVGPALPAFSAVESDFSLHSLNYGLQFRY